MATLVLATFTDREAAHEAARHLRQSVPSATVRVGARDDVTLALQCSQQVEMNESVPMAPMGVVAGPFARGAIVWGLAGMVLGAALAIPIGLIVPTGAASRTGVLLGIVLAGAIAGAVALGVYGAGRQPVVEGAGGVPDPRAVVRIDLPDGESDDRGREQVDELMVRCHAVDVFHPRHVE
jgi:hypothetical protein